MNPIRHITKGTFGYHVLTLASGTLAGQLILFISLFFLQRAFYGPAAFGVFTLYVSLSELLIDMSGFKYELAIVNGKRVKDTLNTFLLSVSTVMFFSLAVLGILIAIYILFPEMKMVKELGITLFLIPVSIFCFGSFNAMNYWLNNKEKYGSMSAGKIINSLSSEPIKFALAAPLKYGGAGLIVGRVFGQFLLFVYSLYLFYKNDRKVLRIASRRRMQHLSKLHRNYPLFVMPGTLITTGITYLFFQFIFEVFGNEKVGLLGPSISYVGVAFSILSTAFAQVFYKKISTISDYGELKKIYLKFAGLLFIPGTALFLFVYILPNAWVVLLLGERWGEILPITRIMVLWMTFSSVALSLSHIHLRMNTQAVMFRLELVHLILVIVALLVSYYKIGTFYGTLYLFTGVQIFYYAMAILTAIYLLDRKQKSGAV